MGAAVRQSVVALLVIGAACAKHVAPPPPPPALEPEHRVVPPRRTSVTGVLTAAERDSLVRDVATRRAAWRARHISDYRIQIAVGCFCPWPDTPAILTVKNGAIVALDDTSGKSMGKPREPWSLYTVDSLFSAVEQAAGGSNRSDMIEVVYDPAYDYPALIRGYAKARLPDNWFWVKASRLTPSR